jgi:hypothetical protein
MAVHRAMDLRARAIYGLVGDAAAVELIDVDAGKIVCATPWRAQRRIVGVTEEAIVCADRKGTRAIGLDGKRKWSSRRVSSR